ADVKFLTGAIELGEAVADVGEAHATPENGGGILRAETNSGVGNLHDQAGVLAMRGNGDVHANAAGLHAVAEGILQERLQDQLRNEGVLQSRIDRIADAKLVFVTLLHELQVDAGDFEFFGKPDFVSSRDTQGEAQEITQLREHGVRGAHVFVHQRRDGVQGVEQEVRLELQAEIFELGLGELGL